MRVIIPISLLLFAVVAPTVFRSMSSSRRLLSHYVPTLLLSFVKTPACICRHTFIHVYSFFSFYPLIASRHPLVNMIFLNSYPLARLSFVIYRHFSYSVEFHPGFSSRTGVTSLILSTIAFIPSLSLSLFPSLLCQSSSHSFVFLFSSSLWRAPFFPFFVSPLYCTSSPCPILHYYFLASFFHFVSPHTVFIVPSQVPQSPRYTPQPLARRNGFSFSACHTCIRRA